MTDITNKHKPKILNLSRLGLRVFSVGGGHKGTLAYRKCPVNKNLTGIFKGVENPLKSLISELVHREIEEITARTGPRTGGFQFPPEVIDLILRTALKVRDEIKAKVAPKEEIKKFKVTVPSPITGKPYVIPVWIYWDETKKSAAAGYLHPYKGGGKGRLGINVFHADDVPYLRSTIQHELVHAFDPELTKGETPATVNAMRNPDRKAYWKGAGEQKAFLHQIINDMAGSAEKLTKRIDNAPEFSLAQTWLKKPELLIRHTMNLVPAYKMIIDKYRTDPFLKDTDFIRKLYRAAFDVTRSYLEPAVEARLKQIAGQKNF